MLRANDPTATHDADDLDAPEVQEVRDAHDELLYDPNDPNDSAYGVDAPLTAGSEATEGPRAEGRRRAAARRRGPGEAETDSGEDASGKISANDLDGGITDDDPTGGAFEQTLSMSGGSQTHATSDATSDASAGVDRRQDAGGARDAARTPTAPMPDVPPDSERHSPRPQSAAGAPAPVEPVEPVEFDEEEADHVEEHEGGPDDIDEELGVPTAEAPPADVEAEIEAEAAASEQAHTPEPKPAPVAGHHDDGDDEDEPPAEDVTPATPPKITHLSEVDTSGDVTPPWATAPAAELPSVPSRGEMARSLTWHVCPFCGHKNESAHTPCESCGMMDSTEARTATVRRGGPWFVRQPGNPGGPGMKFAVMQDLVRSGEIRSGTVIRGPSTQQLWTFAARVRGLAHLFGLCWNCNRRLQAPEPGEQADDFCIYCGALLDAPSNPDQQLEAVRPTDPSRLRGGADRSPAGQRALPSPHDAGGRDDSVRSENRQSSLPAPEPLALTDDPEGKGLLTTAELERVFNFSHSRRGEILEQDADHDDSGGIVGRIILGLAALAVVAAVVLWLLDLI